MSEPCWEQRWHPFRQQWVIVAAHRQERPWLGERDSAPAPASRLPQHDPACTFCPRNARVLGAINPDYRGVFVFDNDKPCVGAAAPLGLAAPPPGYRSSPARGVARVVSFSERHDLHPARADAFAMDRVLACLQEQYRELSRRDDVAHVLMFENRGEAVGVSNPHPHGQIYATNFVFETIAREREACRERFDATGRSLWEDVVRTELQDGRRVLMENADAISFLPWFARYAYETYVGPKRAVHSVADLDDTERMALAQALHATIVRFDNLWQQPFPYVMALHQAPTDGERCDGFGFHVEFHPPMRKPGLRKFLAGPEIGGGNFLADTAPEQSAIELRAVPAAHYDPS